MKIGEKILLALGTMWTFFLGVLFVNGIMIHGPNIGTFLVVFGGLLIVWTVLRFVWLFIYGRHERSK